MHCLALQQFGSVWVPLTKPFKTTRKRWPPRNSMGFSGGKPRALEGWQGSNAGG